MRGWSLFAGIACCMCVARSAAAQAELTAHEQPAAPAARAPDAITPPSPISATAMAYPDQAQGDADVVLELLIDESGHVADVKLVSGDEPFAGSALAAAPFWQFAPAQRGARPVAARVRFQVHFSQPSAPVPEPEAQPPALVAPPPRAPASPSAPQASAPPVVLTVQGERNSQARTLSQAEVRQLPGAFGDPFRAIEALPGVTPIASGAPYFYVRGAPPGNVGYYFDGVRVPVLFHAAAGPSVIHPAFVDNVQLYSGGYPARYGRFAGAIVAADAVEPEHRVRGQASVRLVDSGAMLEVPFANDRGDVLLAGRYSYTAAVVSLLVPQLSLAYWDYQARVGFDLTRSDRLSVLAFGSLDSAAQKGDDGVKKTIYGTSFERLDLRYDRRISDSGKLRLAATLGADRTQGMDDVARASGSMRAARAEYRDQLSDSVRLEAGADLSFESFRVELAPFAYSKSWQTETDFVYNASSHRDLISGAYLGLVADVSRTVRVSPGLRFDRYQSGSNSAYALEPRVSARYQLSRHVALVDAFGIAHQMPSFVGPVPGLQPDLGSGLQLAVQSSSGIELELPEDTTASLTLFHTASFNATDRLGLVRLKSQGKFTSHDQRALGDAEGIELLLQRKLTRHVGGFLAYTLSRSRRALLDVEGPSAYDRTHVLNVAATWDLGRHWRAGARALFYSGIPAQVAYTPVAHRPPRTPPFYRFDWRLEKRWQLSENAYWAFILEVLNTTLHKEVLSESCSAFRCSQSEFGPVTVPSIGVEAGF